MVCLGAKAPSWIGGFGLRQRNRALSWVPPLAETRPGQAAIAGSPREVYFADWNATGPGDEVCDVAFPMR
jgi:hypothetical protein